MKRELSIMLVDDNQSANYYHRLMMEAAGISSNRVIEFSSSENALAYLNQFESKDDESLYPEVILLDINMPLINGWKFVGLLEKYNLKRFPDIYMVSNSRHPNDIKLAEEHPRVQGLFEKHVDQKFFEKLIKKFESI